MSRVEIVLTRCDKCGVVLEDGAKPTRLGVDGAWRELDLCDDHKATLLARLSQWLEVGRQETRSHVRRRAGRSVETLPAAVQKRRQTRRSGPIAHALADAVTKRK
jgi:hypothetical protein